MIAERIGAQILVGHRRFEAAGEPAHDEAVLQMKKAGEIAGGDKERMRLSELLKD